MRSESAAVAHKVIAQGERTGTCRSVLTCAPARPRRDLLGALSLLLLRTRAPGRGGGGGGGGARGWEWQPPWTRGRSHSCADGLPDATTRTPGPKLRPSMERRRSPLLPCWDLRTAAAARCSPMKLVVLLAPWARPRTFASVPSMRGVTIRSAADIFMLVGCSHNGCGCRQLGVGAHLAYVHDRCVPGCRQRSICGMTVAAQQWAVGLQHAHHAVCRVRN